VSIFIPTRRPSREWLDDPGLAGHEVVRNLADLARVDQQWGGSRTLARWLLSRPAVREGRTSVLDLGAGSAQPTRRLRSALEAGGLAADVVALDLQWRHLAAGALMNGRESLPAVAADARRLPLPDASVDWVVSTLFLHHFSPDELAALFSETRRVARRGFALLDLRRHRIPLAFLALAGRFLFESSVSLHDAPASVRQAYTPEELRRILEEAGTNAVVQPLFPFRLLVCASERQTSDAKT
jgi:SAM-dependent methyltransferase